MKLDLPLREVMTGPVETVQASDSLTDALTRMLNGGFHHVPVVDGDQLVGILSAADIAAILHQQDPALAGTGVVLADDDTVASRMTTDVVTLGIDAPIRDAVKLFSVGHFHGVPVVAGGRLVGIFTTRDLARHLLAD